MSPAEGAQLSVIPDADHVARHCKPSWIYQGLPKAEAFRLRAGEFSLSVNWLEYLRGVDIDDCLCLLRPIIARKRTVRPTHRFAVLQVGPARKALHRADQQGVIFRHDPDLEDQSHAGIFLQDAEEDTVALVLKDLVRREDMVPAI